MTSWQNISILRKLLLDFLVGARNRKNAYRIHGEQELRDRITLCYIEPMLKKHVVEYRFFHRCYRMLAIYCAALCAAIPVVLVLIPSESVIIIALGVLNAVNFLIFALVRLQFNSNWVSKYAQK